MRLRAEHVEYSPAIKQVLSNGAVRGAVGSNCHITGHRLPVVQHGVEIDTVALTLAIELQSLEVCDNKLPLRCLIKLELKHLWPILGFPGFHYFREADVGEIPVAALFEEKCIAG